MAEMTTGRVESSIDRFGFVHYLERLGRMLLISTREIWRNLYDD